MKIIWFAFALHLIFLSSVFDIYFTTPIVHGIPFEHNVFLPPAKRLVLFVADGMRADTFYHLTANETKAPFLRNIIEKTGTWGVSHTRVPTESRPGHVAIIAGLYEDPSAITKGWQENPVEFDSVFNRSTFTWAWGSPDILPMFSKASGDRMWTEMYAAEDQDFSGGHKSTSWLDDWVFTKFEDFMRHKALRETYHSKRIHRSGIVFFLHLLAMDTAGHTFKPHSWEYQRNIELINNGLQKVVGLVEDFYGHDGKTAYILTADHGMTDWGSHGAGDASETQTPVVAWGAGVPQVMPSDSTACSKESQGWPEVDDQGWNLSGLCRHDTWQADIAPLMATLIGVPIPVNSVGYLRRSYLDLGAKEMAQAAFTNARQMLSQHTHRRALMEQPWGCDSEGGQQKGWLCTLINWLPSFYWPYPQLPPQDEIYRLASISNHIEAGNYVQAVAESDQLFTLASSGLEYHHRYHKGLLLTTTSLSFIAWILLLLMLIMGGHLDHIWGAICGWEVKLSLDIPMALLSTCMGFYLFVLASPVQYYVYCLLPFALWWGVARLVSNWSTNRRAWTSGERRLDKWSMLSSALLVAAYWIGIEILVLSFFHRWLLSLGMVGLALLPFTRVRPKADTSKSFYWAASCFVLGVFPLMPIVGKEVDTALVTMASLLFVTVGMLASLFHGGALTMAPGGRLNPGYLSSALATQWPLWVQVALLLPLATWNLGKADESFNQNQGLPLMCQVMSWTLSGLSIGLPLAMRHTLSLPRTPLRGISQQLLCIALALAVPYILLSVNHEGFFLLALVINLHAWVLVEVNMNTHQATSKQVSWDNLRISYTFVFLIITSFFGTGNMASINSFDPAWVRRFLSVFSPHVMGALILAKTCIPFLLVSCAFRAVNVLLKTQTKQLFLIVLALSDACGLHFLHLVKDKGSWLDIGSSLSHFIIQETMVVFLLLLYALSCSCVPSIPFTNTLHTVLSDSVCRSSRSFDEESQGPSWTQKNKRS
ncbi:GPI ethanolamine phosphate transferase 1 [Hetaerina americana]|uniref:GPI ethanolamine phosphate transferase 1 n=1 Tax=Hetaerina americana TaxID=62018 RepID=UPI003A7F3632